MIAAIVLLVAVSAQSPLPASCSEIRAYVAAHGPAAALAEAQRRGWTSAQIRRARRECARA